MEPHCFDEEALPPWQSEVRTGGVVSVENTDRRLKHEAAAPPVELGALPEEQQGSLAEGGPKRKLTEHCLCGFGYSSGCCGNALTGGHTAFCEECDHDNGNGSRHCRCNCRRCDEMRSSCSGGEALPPRDPQLQDGHQARDMPAKKQRTPTAIDLTHPNIGSRQQVAALIAELTVGMEQLPDHTETRRLVNEARLFIAIADKVTVRRAQLRDERMQRRTDGYLPESDSGVPRTTAPSDPEAVEEEQYAVRRVLSFLVETLLAMHVPLGLERTFDVRDEWLSFAQGNRQGGIFRLSLQGFVAAGVSRCSESITGAYP
jgi:hypothetical protein